VVKSPSSEGIVFENKLVSNLRYTSLDQYRSTFIGISPVKRFTEKSTVSRFVRREKVWGKVLENEFAFRCKPYSFVKLPNSSGTTPVNELSPKCRP
jgi:hypothetical protein